MEGAIGKEVGTGAGWDCDTVRYQGIQALAFSILKAFKSCQRLLFYLCIPLSLFSSPVKAYVTHIT